MQLQYAKHELPHLPGAADLMPHPVPMGSQQAVTTAMADVKDHAATLQHLSNGGLKRSREEPSSHEDTPPGKRAAAEGGDLAVGYGDGGEVTRLPVRCFLCLAFVCMAL